MAIKIRDFFIALGVRTNLKEVKAFDIAVNRSTNNLYNMLTAAQFAAIAITGLTAAFATSIRSTARESQELDALAVSLSTSAIGLQELKLAFDEVGAQPDDLADALLTLNDRFSDLAHEVPAFTEAFALIGVTSKDVTGDVVKDFDMFVRKFEATKNAVDRTAAATQLFGDDLGKRLIPLLGKGAADLARVRKQAHELHLVFTDMELKGLRKMSRGFETLWAIVKGVRTEFAIQLAPRLQNLIDLTVQWVRVNRSWITLRVGEVVNRVSHAILTMKSAWEEVHKFFSENIGNWQETITAIEAALATFAAIKAFQLLTNAIKLTTVALTALRAMSLGVFSGWILGAAGAAAAVFGIFIVFDDLFHYMKGKKSFIGDFFDEFRTAPGVIGEMSRMVEQSIKMWDLFLERLDDIEGFGDTLEKIFFIPLLHLRGMKKILTSLPSLLGVIESVLRAVRVSSGVLALNVLGDDKNRARGPGIAPNKNTVAGFLNADAERQKLVESNRREQGRIMAVLGNAGTKIININGAGDPRAVAREAARLGGFTASASRVSAGLVGRKVEM